MILTLAFWKDAFERAVSTAAQTLSALLILAIPANALVTFAQIGWVEILQASAISGLLSVVKSVAATFRGDTQSASFIKSNTN